MNGKHKYWHMHSKALKVANKDQRNKLEKLIRTSYMKGGSKTCELTHSQKIWEQKGDYQMYMVTFKVITHERK